MWHVGQEENLLNPKESSVDKFFAARSNKFEGLHYSTNSTYVPVPDCMWDMHTRRASYAKESSGDKFFAVRGQQ
jgi:hypothetical protein